MNIFGFEMSPEQFILGVVMICAIASFIIVVFIERVGQGKKKIGGGG